MNYDQALDYLVGQGNFGIKPGLERIKSLLAALGNPQAGLSYVHVAGTNGKGSVTAMLASMFGAAGLKVGRYTSPHLEKWNERINIRGRDVADDELAAALTAVRAAAEGGQIAATQFELLTAAAFWLFKKAGLDIVALEAGMGGLLDATNVITPECVVVTNIGLDHTQYLGGTLETIAGEKAGIIKPGVPVVTGTESVALNVVVAKAAFLRAPICILRADFTAIGMGGSINRQRFLFRRGDFVADFTLGLGGDHQVSNAALAIMAAKLLGERHPEITLAAMQKGLEDVVWAGRLQVRGGTTNILLDGAHNVGGARVLRAALDKYYPGKDITFVLGIMQDKDIKGIVEELTHSSDTLIAVRADGSERAAAPAEIAAFGKGRVLLCGDLAEALRQAEAEAGADGVVCIAGSLYLAGRVKKIWETTQMVK